MSYINGNHEIFLQSLYRLSADQGISVVTLSKLSSWIIFCNQCVLLERKLNMDFIAFSAASSLIRLIIQMPLL